jgi:hypothetical protein
MSTSNGSGPPPPDGDSPGGVDLNLVWTGVAAEVWRRHPGRVERTAARLLRSPGLARALVTTPSLLVPWLIATVAVFGLGGVISVAGGQPVIWLLAPAVAAVAIACAYGPGADPAWELTHSMAVSDRMVLLVRAVTVFAVNALLGIAVSLASYFAMASGVVPKGTGATAAAITVGWLLPMTAICALTLAVAVAALSAVAGAVAGVAAWAVTVFVSAAVGQFNTAVTDDSSYLPYLAVTACAALAVAVATRSRRRIQ